MKLPENLGLEDLNIVCIIRHGSHLYGLNTPDSDVDYKGVYIPDPCKALLGIEENTINFSTSSEEQKNNKDDIDVTLYSIQKFVSLLIEGDTIAFDMIHCNEENLLQTSAVWKELVDLRSMFYSKNAKAFMGYVRKQAHKYGIRGSRINSIQEVIKILTSVDIDKPKLSDVMKTNTEKLKVLDFVEVYPSDNDKKSLILIAGSKYFYTTPIRTILESLEKKLESYGNRANLAAENEGVDWKAVSHAIRAGYQLEEIFTTGDLKYPLVDRKYLLSVKLGERDFNSEVSVELDRITERVKELAESSSYQEHVDSKLVYAKLMRILKDNL